MWITGLFTLAFGMLTGKYDNGTMPDGARLTLFGDMFTRYTKPKGKKYAERFNDLQKKIIYHQLKWL